MAKHSLTELLDLVSRRDLRAELVQLDSEIEGMRATLASSQDTAAEKMTAEKKTYEDVDDIPRLQRLVKARNSTVQVLQKKVGWAALDSAKE